MLNVGLALVEAIVGFTCRFVSSRLNPCFHKSASFNSLSSQKACLYYIHVYLYIYIYLLWVGALHVQFGTVAHCSDAIFVHIVVEMSKLFACTYSN